MIKDLQELNGCAVARKRPRGNAQHTMTFMRNMRKLVNYFKDVLEGRELMDKLDSEEEEEGEERGPALAGGQHRRCTLAGDVSLAS
jgi:hypothetical protein